MKYFLSSWAVQEAEAHVEECRGRRPSQQKADVVQALRAHDSVESGPQVPASVLDECEKSFSAANENQSKAASNIFSDTGLMALICWHDHPLFIVNMTTAGVMGCSRAGSIKSCHPSHSIPSSALDLCLLINA